MHLLDWDASKSLSAEVLNAQTPARAAQALLQSGLELRLLPVCPPSHEGASKAHIATCSNPGKAPLVKNWTERATEAIEVIDSWFRQYPNCNLGLLTGVRGGILAIDVDGPYGRAKLIELFHGNIPITWHFTTPGGGERYLFKAPRGQPVRKYTDAVPGGLHEELAVLADGQMTVLPPSLHSNGYRYAWTLGRGPGDVPLADVPEEIIVLLTPGIAKTYEKAVDGSTEGDVGTPEQGVSNPTQLDGLQEPQVIHDPTLNLLTQKCKKVRFYATQQTEAGCDEETWHKLTSMMVRGGHPAAALAFSRLSDKHNSRSDKRIQQMANEGDQASYGPTRCATFGCSEEQVRGCFGQVRKDSGGNITNSPASFVSSKEAGNVTEMPADGRLESKLQWLSNRYVTDGDNLCVVQTDKNGNPVFIPLANFFAWINKDIVLDDGAERQRFYELEGILLSSSKRLPPIRVEASEFETMKWLANWGPEPNIFPGPKIRDTVRHAIQSTAGGATHEQVFAHLGWTMVDGRWVYLHAGGAIGAADVKVDLDPRLKNYALHDSDGDAQEAMKHSIQLLEVASHRVTLALWGLVFLSALCEGLRSINLEPKFLLWLHGYTGTRKTTLAKLFLCHFGELLEHPSASFKDTANSVEKRGFDTKDSLLLIDDYHPSGSAREAGAMRQLAQQILRGYGDRVGRGRMRADTTLRSDYPPRGMAIVTAEDLITGSSSLARLFPVELKPSDVNLERLTQMQANSQHLSTAMIGYLTWLADAMNGARGSQWRHLFYDRRNEAAQLNVHGRLVEAASWLYLGLHSGLEYAAYIGAIEPERKDFLLQEGWLSFLDAANEQGRQADDVKPTALFIGIVAELLATRRIYVVDLNRSDHLGEIPTTAQHVGWYDNSYYYLLPKVIYNSACRFLSERHENFPLTEVVLWKQLADEGITVTETAMDRNTGKERRHNLCKKQVGDDRSRKLWVRAEFMGEQQQDARVRRRPERSHPEEPAD